MKKLMGTILLILIFGNLSYAAKIAITVGTGALQPGTTAGFNVSSGTVQELSNVNQRSTGTYTITGGTMSWLAGVSTGTRFDRSTTTFIGAGWNGTVLDNSTTTHRGTHVFQNLVSISTRTGSPAVLDVTPSSVTVGSSALAGAVYGTNTNDNAGVGTYGETISSAALSINFPASASYGDLASISLTPGNWMLSGTITVSTTAALVPFAVVGALTTAGDNPPSAGLCRTDFPVSPSPAGNDAVTQSFNSCQFKLASTTTVFLKYRANFSGGTPKATGVIIGLRIR